MYFCILFLCFILCFRVPLYFHIYQETSVLLGPIVPVFYAMFQDASVLLLSVPVVCLMFQDMSELGHIVPMFCAMLQDASVLLPINPVFYPMFHGTSVLGPVVTMFYLMFQGTSVLGPIVPIGLHITFAVYIMSHSTVDLFENHPVLFVLTWGMIFSKITCKLIVSIWFGFSSQFFFL